MPEKALGLGYAGMASMEGTGSSGSCDSVASIASNQSALSNESYDYLSAEERDVLMYLEETIDSLDTDSGLSTDDSERVEETPETPDSPKNTDPKNPYASQTLFVEGSSKPTVEKNGMSSYRGSTRILDEPPKPNYNSLPKNMMIPRVELVKNAPVPADTPTPPAFEKLLNPEKPKRKSLANAKEEDALISEIGLIPPPELFRDTDSVVRRASFKKDALGVKSEVSVLNHVDDTELEMKSGMPLGKDQHLDASPLTSDVMKTKGDHTVAPLQQRSPVPPASEGYNEPIKEMVDFAAAQLQPVQIAALATDREPVKKIGDPTHVHKEHLIEAPPASIGDADPLQKYGDITCVPMQHSTQTPCRLTSDPEPDVLKKSQDTSHLIEQTSPAPASATGNSEPPKQMVVLKPLWKATSLVPPAFQGATEAKKEPDAAKSPTRKTDQGLQALPLNDEPAKASGDIKPASHPPTLLTPALQTQPSMGHSAVLLTPASTAEYTDQNNVLSQDHRVKSVSHETLQYHADKTVDTFFKQGPKTHPKPLKLPPHIIVKTTYVSTSLEPQQRYRTQSLINAPTPTRTKSTNVKSHIIRDQLTARQEALEKLKLSQGKTNLQSESSVKPAPVSKKEELPVPQAGTQKSMNPEQPEDNQNNQKFVLQDKTNVRSNQVKPSVGMWSRQFPAAPEKAVPISSSPPKLFVVPKSSEIQIPQSSKEKLSNHGRVEDDQISPKSAWQDKVKTFSVSPEKVYGGLRSREFPSRQAEVESGKLNSPKKGVEVDESIPKSSRQDKSSVSTSMPEKVSGSLKQNEIPPSDHSMGRQSVAEKIKILSRSQLDLSSEQGFRLPQGSVPGLRDISFKSNTLERSGIGLSNVKQDGDESKSDSGSSSFFKKLSPTNFHSNFSKKNRQRPVSIGTAGEFIAIQEGVAVPEGTSEPAKSENRRFAPFSLFPPKPRPSSLISVKFTPKSTADEHREALKKLGLLHN